MNANSSSNAITKSQIEQQKYNDKRYAKIEEVATLASANNNSTLTITVGTSNPNDGSIWLDTSNYRG